MRRRSDHALAAEDRILWEKVARTVTPLGPRLATGTEIPEVQEFEAAMTEIPLPHANPTAPAAKKAPAQPKPPQALDPATARKIARGRLVIEARIDLHGLTQDEAHAMLLDFVARAAQRHVRTVLVITGKGRSPRSEGALRRAVPMWLAQPAFARHVSGHAEAAPGHGGAGALYLRMRLGAGQV
jgi:DNA-nicking Smr family endonuclease